MTDLLSARVAALRASVPEVEVEACAALVRDGALLIDVRETDEREAGSPQGAVGVSRGLLELRIAELAPSPERTLLLVCGSGTRSLFAAEALRALGYSDARSVRGGVQRWREAGLPMNAAGSGGLGPSERARYARHLALPEVGEAGQLRLKAARVLLVGAGGLGSPAALYLAAAGVGTLDVVDFDVVDRSNLQRQVLHTEGRVGRLKVESAREALLALNPNVTVNAHAARVTDESVDALVAPVDVVLDGTDNFGTRYRVNDACVRAGKPYVYGSVHRFEGQVGVFWPAWPGGPSSCYRCLFPAAPPPSLAPNCAQVGVLGVLPGIVGLLQAVEVLKLLLRLGTPLVGQVACYDALAAELSRLRVPRALECATCGAGVT
jgi:molybdopterin/thiamine biosynthesis adenylyltransferase/rhodanese-related sulfurtransferase